jgi:glutamine synthetase
MFSPRHPPLPQHLRNFASFPDVHFIIKGWTSVIHWTPTSTSCRRESWLGCGRCLAAWTRRCGSWRPTTSSCCGAGVFTSDLLGTRLEYKRRREVDPIRLRPHPYEFYLYYDI